MFNREASWFNAKQVYKTKSRPNGATLLKTFFIPLIHQLNQLDFPMLTTLHDGEVVYTGPV